jgi:hypothetical protein
MESDIVTITEVIAYISASLAAILYIIDTLIPLCKKKKPQESSVLKRPKRRSSHWQYKRSVRRSPTLEERELKRQYTQELEGLIVNSNEILENKKVETQNQFGFSDEDNCDVFLKE